MNENIRWISPFSGEVELNEIISLMSNALTKRFSHKNAILRFEKDFSIYINSKGASAVNMGRTAIIVALNSLNLKPGDEAYIHPEKNKIIVEAGI